VIEQEERNDRDFGSRDWGENGELGSTHPEHPGVGRWFRTFGQAKRAALNQIKSQIKTLEWMWGTMKKFKKAHIQE